MNTILGTKVGMTQTFVDGKRVGVSVINAGPCTVTQIKDNDRDGYSALQISFGNRATKNISKALKGHLKIKDDAKEAPKFIQEVSIEEGDEFKEGDSINISEIFAAGDTISVTGTGKGKGFAGVVKRWNFAGGPATHGSTRYRRTGSIGQGTTPGRVFKGKKMPGHMGSETATIKNLKVIEVDAENNILKVSGSIPGSKGTLLTIKRISPKQEVEVQQEEVNTESNEN